MVTKKGVSLAITTVIVWAVLNVLSRYCVLKYDVNIIVFTYFLIFAGGVALMLIRQKVSPGNWHNGVKYSWMYTSMEIIRSFSMITTYLYINTTEASLLFNLEVVITYLVTYLAFRRLPEKNEYWGILVILAGIILFLFSLPEPVRFKVGILIFIASTASCIRSVVVEKTTTNSPATTVRQKCGISGYTMFVGGSVLILLFTGIAVFKEFLPAHAPGVFAVLDYLPDIREVLHPETIISACVTGFFINSATIYLFYSTLQFTHSETFMAVRAFQPAIVYGIEVGAAFYYYAMHPMLTTRDYILGGVIILGSLLILVIPSKGKFIPPSKDFIAE